jgi:hypothetical protein
VVNTTIAWDSQVLLAEFSFRLSQRHLRHLRSAGFSRLQGVQVVCHQRNERGRASLAVLGMMAMVRRLMVRSTGYGGQELWSLPGAWGSRRRR